jgi:hypothetical protein
MKNDLVEADAEKLRDVWIPNIFRTRKIKGFTVHERLRTTDTWSLRRFSDWTRRDEMRYLYLLL